MKVLDKRRPEWVEARVRRMRVEVLVTDFEFAAASTTESILGSLPGIDGFVVEPGSGKTTIVFRTDEPSLAAIVDVLPKAGFYTIIGSVSSR